MDTPRLPLGAWVKVSNQTPETHCRTPCYLRGVIGRVEEVVGRYRDPSLLAFHKPGLPMLWLYRVRFRQQDIWPSYVGGENDAVIADLYEHWLDILME